MHRHERRAEGRIAMPAAVLLNRSSLAKKHTAFLHKYD